jgi:hypothetical protein
LYLDLLFLWNAIICGTRLFVERDYLWNAFIFVERVYLWNVFFLWNALLMSLWNVFLCGACLFVEWCYKETNATQEVVNNDKGDEEKVEEVFKLALVHVVNDMTDVEKEPSKVPPQQVKHLEIAATKTKKSLRLQEQNALATAKKKDKLEAQKIAVNRRKKRELEQVKISLQQNKERGEDQSKNATKVAEEKEASKHEFDSSSTESSKGGNVSAFSPEQCKDEDSGKCLSVLYYRIFTCP